MAFITVSCFIPRLTLCTPLTTTPVKPQHIYHVSQRTVTMTGGGGAGAPLGGNGKKPSRNRRYRQNKSGGNPAAVEKKKLEAETVFMEESPSRLELIIPTISILTVIGIFPFVGAVARALWVRYKFTSRRISVTSGFRGKDQTEIIYRDIDQIKYVRRLGDAADCVITLKDGAKLELRSLPNFDKAFEYVMERVDEDVRDASGPA